VLVGVYLSVPVGGTRHTIRAGNCAAFGVPVGVPLYRADMTELVFVCLHLFLLVRVSR